MPSANHRGHALAPFARQSHISIRAGSCCDGSHLNYTATPLLSAMRLGSLSIEGGHHRTCRNSRRLLAQGDRASSVLTTRLPASSCPASRSCTSPPHRCSSPCLAGKPSARPLAAPGALPAAGHVIHCWEAAPRAQNGPCQSCYLKRTKGNPNPKVFR